MYTNKQTLEAYLKRTLTESEDALFSVLNPQIKKAIDDYTDSNFSKVDPSTRYYDVGRDQTMVVDLDPCTDVTAVAIVDNDNVVQDTYDANTYILEPQNEPVKREIRYRNAYWPQGEANIAVTARFSEWVNGVPEDITIAATRLAATMLNTFNTQSDNGTIKSESLEGHRIEYADVASSSGMDDPIVKTILRARRQPLVG
jgi:hypothetical protein